VDTCYKPRVYIGQGDGVLDRLQSHLRNKDFWITALVFKRKDSLNAGSIKYLEARLCDVATKYGTCLLTNSITPSFPSLPAAEKSETEDFLEKVLFFLPALGWNFFEAAKPAVPDTTCPVAIAVAPPRVPPNIRRRFEELKQILSGLGDAEFYYTMTPDYRARVTSGLEFRVFTRLKLTNYWIRLKLNDVGDFRIFGSEDLRGEVLKAIYDAHKKAGLYLSRAIKPRAGATSS
jgi:hypothetical protein